jgi:hypothetical protein
MKTRKQYLNDEISHSEYYAQFITDTMISNVKNNIGIERIKKSKDEHFNDIPLKEWDALNNFVFKIVNGSETCVSRPIVDSECIKKIKDAEEWISSATIVCINKEIARQIKAGKIA